MTVEVLCISCLGDRARLAAWLFVGWFDLFCCGLGQAQFLAVCDHNKPLMESSKARDHPWDPRPRSTARERERECVSARANKRERLGCFDRHEMLVELHGLLAVQEHGVEIRSVFPINGQG